MIKQLFIIRHAQAEDGGNSGMLRDFDRDLTSKGIIQSARMGKFLFDSNTVIDRFVSSPANRAADTARVMMEQLKADKDELVINRELYGGGARAYLRVINDLSETVSSVAIFGHNPDISFFAEYLTRSDTNGEMKKATVIQLEFEDLEWAAISGQTATFIRRIDVDDLRF
jgi:phosphohistidine phosphatase